MMPAVERADVEHFRTLIGQRLGLQCDSGKVDQLTGLLRQRMAAARCSRPDAYLECLAASSAGSEELRVLAEELTVTETFFFRNADQFRACAAVVLPERIRARQREKRLHILSAGCASGEEAYSLAILVREALPDQALWDVKITGLDINRSMLTRAIRARYSAWALRGMSEAATRRYFKEAGRGFALDASVQGMVSFDERNLVDNDPLFWQAIDCDVVFCRNVLMYFTPEGMRDVVHRLTQALLPGGFLFLGHAETLRGLSHEFRLCHTHDTFYYQRGERSTRESALSSRPRSSGEISPAPVLAHTTTSWVDAIQRASDRITSLADRRAQESQRRTAKTVAVPPPGVRSWNLNLVLETMRQERFGDALALLGALPADAYHDVDALLVRAVLLTNGGQLEEAQNVCTRLLALDELNASAHYLMALCREHAGDITGAIEHDQTAIYLDVGFAMPHLHLGLAAKRSGDEATAHRELGEALTLLGREDASRVLLFGGGFSRDALLQLCRTELRTVGGPA